MTRMRKLGVLAVVALAAGAVVTPARAQVAGASVGVVFENLDGATVDCDPPTPGPKIGDMSARLGCDVSLTASGGQIQNRCQEAVSISAPPVQNGTAVTGCSVTVTGTLFGTSTATRVTSDGDGGGVVAVQCSAPAGVGTATYSPSGLGGGIPMSGPVLLTYANGVLTVAGALVNVSTVTAGNIKATGVDPCGPDNLAHPFAGTIN